MASIQLLPLVDRRPLIEVNLPRPPPARGQFLADAVEKGLRTLANNDSGDSMI